MRVLVTGGTGFVGRFVVEGFVAAGHEVVIAGRRPPTPGFFSAPVAFRPMTLDPAQIGPGLVAGIDHLVHAAFHHVPGRYRGGEGDAPADFVRFNLDGSVALFEAAKKAGVQRAVFLSSRAVYGTQPPGAVLTEETVPTPDTLYGEVKLQAETALAALAGPAFATASLRATGVYGPPGPGQAHKWSDLLADYLDGRPVAPRCGTEVHGDDLASAVRRVIEGGIGSGAEVFNVSDILVDRRDILAIVAQEMGRPPSLPAAADARDYNLMSTDKLRTRGWRPGGRPLFEGTVRRLIRDFLDQRAGF